MQPDVTRNQESRMPPGAPPSKDVVTMKTEGCVLTLGPLRC